MTKELTDTEVALLERLYAGNEFARWTSAGEKKFLLQGVPVFTLPEIKAAVKKGLASIEAGVGLNEGFDFLVITEKGKERLYQSVK